MKRELTDKEKANIRIMQLVLGRVEGWQDIVNLINEKIATDVRNCFDNKGEFGDEARNRGHALEELLVEIETIVKNGQELLKEEQA